MSKRLHVVEIEDYGPVTVRSLTKRQLETCQRLGGGNDLLVLVHVIRRGMVEPKSTDEFLAEIQGTPDVLDEIATAILEHSWPNREV